MTPEAKTLSESIAFLKAAPECWHTKVRGGAFSVRGLPDIIACVAQLNGKGRFLAIEVKSSKGKLTPLQTHEKARIEAAGGTYVVARSVMDVKKAFDRLDGLW